MPWNGPNGSHDAGSPVTVAPPSVGLVQALDTLRMRIPHSTRSARSRRRPQYAGAWIQVSPNRNA